MTCEKTVIRSLDVCWNDAVQEGRYVCLARTWMTTHKSGELVVNQSASEIPASTTFDETSGTLTISYRWLSPVLVVLCILSCIWMYLLIPAVAMAGLSGAMLLFGVFGGGTGILAWLVLNLLLLAVSLVYIAGGAVLTYYALCRAFNTTRIVSDRHTILVEHGPLPWKKSVQVRLCDIEGIYCPQDTGSRNRDRVINALTNIGGKVELLKGLTSADQGRWITSRLRRHISLVRTAESSA